MRGNHVYHHEVQEILTKGWLPDVKKHPHHRVSVPVQADLFIESNREESIRVIRECIFQKEVGPDGELVWVLVTPCIVGR